LKEQGFSVDEDGNEVKIPMTLKVPFVEGSEMIPAFKEVVYQARNHKRLVSSFPAHRLELTSLSLSVSTQGGLQADPGPNKKCSGN
jgi:hypothetical protein